MKLTRYLKKHWDNIKWSVGGALLINIITDIGRGAMIFGGEDMLLVGAVGFWIYQYAEIKYYERYM